MPLTDKGIAYHVGEGRRSGPLTPGCDNVLAWRLGLAVLAASKELGYDPIDGGIALLRHLNDRGFDVVVRAQEQTNAD
jgi:hypothetical protein